MNYQQFSEKSRRLAILAVLFFASGYRLPLRVVRKQTAAIGYDASLDRIVSDAAWLDEQGLALRAGDALVLTDRGSDVMHGRSVQPGVMRPDPGELEDFRRLLVDAGIASAQSALRGE